MYGILPWRHPGMLTALSLDRVLSLQPINGGFPGAGQGVLVTGKKLARLKHCLGFALLRSDQNAPMLANRVLSQVEAHKLAQIAATDQAALFE